MTALIDTVLLRTMAAVSSLKARLTEQRGQDLLEYALLGGLIAAAITAVALVALWTGALNSMANGIARCIDFNSGSVCGPF